ncbi:hypothetical protein BDQ12DRAFT_692776 [Crucibulum laeve]|uniref:Hyaluronan/mRNA-binding protein domain-containing protein n=1 Tax=Crucibulum laeve TaxID=68775 RepID=A0A5C3LU48_9AGAR|nr:hypothetical protein BDQ12DRAFT_692776 [Crucibulum laeve]
MTRTARSSYPRAINRDRSTSRSGLDTSIRKQGAGQHNWGSIADEHVLETSAMNDELQEERSVGAPSLSAAVQDSPMTTTATVAGMDMPEGMKRTNSGGLTEEELQKARKFRKGAFKKNEIDLSAIARTSAAVSGSPPS